jgi:hypothetical protein
MHTIPLVVEENRSCHCFCMRCFLCLALLIGVASSSWAKTPDPSEVAASPKSPWGDFSVVEEKEKRDPWYIQVLLWVPNRVMDFIDIFRVDAGLGPSYGGVIRLSKYAQAGYRKVNPASIRVGDFGRRAPVMAERSSEYGFGPNFVSSKDREICPGEVGVGADIGIAGLYGGVCVDEAADFLAGIFFMDLKHDDLR